MATYQIVGRVLIDSDQARRHSQTIDSLLAEFAAFGNPEIHADCEQPFTGSYCIAADDRIGSLEELEDIELGHTVTIDIGLGPLTLSADGVEGLEHLLRRFNPYTREASVLTGVRQEPPGLRHVHLVIGPDEHSRECALIRHHEQALRAALMQA